MNRASKANLQRYQGRSRSSSKSQEVVEVEQQQPPPSFARVALDRSLAQFRQTAEVV